MPVQLKTVFLFLTCFAVYWFLIGVSGCTSAGETEFKVSNESTFIGSNTCMSCHPQAFEDWKASDHYLAMQPATDSTVLGDFNNTSFTADGVRYKFFKKGDIYFIHTEGSDGLYHDFEVKYTFGYYPLQQYLIAFPGGRLQTTRVSWDSRDNKWFHQYPDQQIDHGDWFHWTGNSQNWNTMCASCHSTNLQKGYDFEKDTYTTTWDEINVSCESCHGPGSTHLEYVESMAYGRGAKLANSGFYYARDTTPQIQLNACASCHARKSDLSPNLIRSDELLDDLIPQVISNEYYYADGQIMEEDYVYGSFTQSKMFHHNVRCTNCHNPHSGKLRLEGNAMCLSCHTANYNTSAHHYHEPGSAGAQCVNCHMVAKTYMGNDHRRDHSFRVPRPDQSVQYGTPNACTNCHQNKSDKWASDAVVQWYGPERQYHFSDDLIPGSLLNDHSEEHLIKLMQDTLQPAISRATATYYLGQIQTMKSVEELLEATNDPAALVRYHALRGLENFPPELWQHKVIMALTDPVRGVRIAAADLYHRLPEGGIPAAARSDYAKANFENLNFLRYQTDFAVGNIMIADYELQSGNYQEAIQYYRRGLKKDSLMNYARLNLATIYSVLGDPQASLKELNKAVQIDPANDRIHYNLGLLYYELGDREKALLAFQKAVDLLSPNPSLYYNYGLALQQSSKLLKAEQILLNGYALDPGAININYALAVFYIQQNRPKQAKKHVDILLDRDPYNPDFQSLLQNLGLKYNQQ